MTTPTDAPAALDDAAIDRRISFHPDIQVMEADFSGLHFEASATVNRVYDRLEARIGETGEDLWFFLVNLNGTRIDPAAWIAYSRRGRALNYAHSMGSVRFDASDDTRQQIERAADTDTFDPNLCPSREAALDRIAGFPSTRRKRVIRAPSHSAEEIARRISFDPGRRIMAADFSDFTFHHGRDVDHVYDHIEARIRDTGRKWFFLVNLNVCRILPAAWVRYAHRGKRLNEAASLGSARYAAGSETEQDIRLRAESQGFRPNIRNTRAEALDLIEEMRGKLLQD